MLSIDEIFYLNKSLGDKKIFGFSYEKSVSNLISSGRNVSDIQNSLIEKGYLSKSDELNKLSFQIIRNLDIYKKANKYIGINKILGAMDDSGFITFFQESLNGCFNFKKTYKELLMLALLKEYEFIRGDREVEEKEEIVSLEGITERLSTKSLDESIYIRKNTDISVYEYNIYFCEDEKTYKYDVLKETIVEKNPRDIRVEIVNTLEINVGGSNEGYKNC